VEEIEVEGPTGPLAGRVFRPRVAAPNGTILWIAGGGFVLDGWTMSSVPSTLVLTSGCTVVSVEYRLAPEHPFPAALEDCYAASRWASDRARDLAGSEVPVAIGGESAGGNLAAATALLARERGGPAIGLQALVCPMTTDRFDGPSRQDFAVGAIACPEAIDWFWDQYLGDRTGDEVLATPLLAESLAGLPPAVVATAEYDVLRDEGEAYAARLSAAGGAVEARRFEGMPHGFLQFPGVLDAADECLTELGEAFGRALRQ
jgi:acetyl esterase